MTTLNVDESALRAAVARYPLVRDVQTSAHPPHRLDIRVIERVPVGVIHADGTAVAVTDDGILLRGVPTGSLPQISASVPPGGARVGDRKTAAKVAVLASAPAALRSRVTSVSLGRYGLQARLRSGLVLRFGDGQQAARQVDRRPARDERSRRGERHVHRPAHPRRALRPAA